MSGITDECCRCPSCIPWVSTRTSWLPFASRLWPGILDELLPEQAKKGCVFTFATTGDGVWVVGDMAIEHARDLPVAGEA
jgi:hypothetical protein